ncbi:MAG: zinc-finger domain-containing protein [Burkholderiaceae bacterium]
MSETAESPKSQAAVELDGHDLPAFCPNPRMPLWNHHPRVYLDIASTGEARCPYCGTVYRPALAQSFTPPTGRSQSLCPGRRHAITADRAELDR